MLPTDSDASTLMSSKAKSREKRNHPIQKSDTQQDVPASLPTQPPKLPVFSAMQGTGLDQHQALHSWLKIAKKERSKYEKKVKRLVDEVNTTLKTKEANLRMQIKELQDTLKVERLSAAKKMSRLEMESTLWLMRLDRDVDKVQRKLHSLHSTQPPRIPDPNPPSQTICPITLDVMEDPVLATDGHTYERSAIERYMETIGDEQTLLSPKTREPLSSRELFPNVAIRSLVRDWQESQSSQQK